MTTQKSGDLAAVNDHLTAEALKDDPHRALFADAERKLIEHGWPATGQCVRVAYAAAVAERDCLLDLIQRLLRGWGSDMGSCDPDNYRAFEEALALLEGKGRT